MAPKYDKNLIAYLSGLEGKLEPPVAQDTLKLLKDDFTECYVTDRASFGLAADLVKVKLGLSRADLLA